MFESAGAPRTNTNEQEPAGREHTPMAHFPREDGIGLCGLQSKADPGGRCLGKDRIVVDLGHTFTKVMNDFFRCLDPHGVERNSLLMMHVLLQLAEVMQVTLSQNMDGGRRSAVVQVRPAGTLPRPQPPRLYGVGYICFVWCHCVANLRILDTMTDILHSRQGHEGFSSQLELVTAGENC